MQAANPPPPVHFDIAGPPDAPPIVLLHGSAWTRKMWLPQLEALSTTFRVIALDLPGHGTLRAQPFRLVDAVQLVHKTLAAQTDRRALLVGLSLGGYVAMACAHDHPEKIAGLVLSGCCIDYRAPIGLLSQLDSLLVTKLFSEERLSRLQESTLQRILPPELIAPQLQAGFSWQAIPQIYRALTAQPTTSPAMLKTFSGPILILNGEHDTPNRKQEARLLRSIPAGQLHIIQSAGHLCNLEQPAAFTEQVRTFASQLNEPTRKPYNKP